MVTYSLHQELADGTYDTVPICRVETKRRAILTGKAIAKTYGSDADVVRIFVVEWSEKVVAEFFTAAAKSKN